MRSIRRGRTPIGGSHHGLPGGIEPNERADVDCEPALGETRQLLRDVERSAAVGIENLGRDALRQHVRRARRASLDAWLWMLTKPGATNRSFASISIVARALDGRSRRARCGR
jgi:hypothetical protein